MIFDFTEYRVKGLVEDIEVARQYAIETRDMTLVKVVAEEWRRYVDWLMEYHPDLYIEHVEPFLEEE